MTDRFAVLWTRAGGTPTKMGSLVATTRECRFSYDAGFVHAGLPGFSLLAPVEQLLDKSPVVRAATERFPLHPRLMALIPPNSPGNLQRRVYAELLSKKKPPPAPGFETEWGILMLAGRNGIGHLDVFPSDLEAEDWYTQQAGETAVIGGRSGIWGLLRDEVRQSGSIGADSAQVLADVMGPTPSVGGMTTKLLAAIPDLPVWGGAMARPGTRAVHQTPYTDAVIKIEQPGYEGITVLEELCYTVHEAMGFRVPRRWTLEIEGLRILAVERFDRTRAGLPIPYESLLTTFSSGSPSVTSTSDLLLPEVAAWIKKLARLCAIDVKTTLREIFSRIAVALMTGNGDLHLDNLGFLGGSRDVVLAPVFDPAPMRAWPRHNMRLATPIDFVHDEPMYRQIAKAGTAFGFTLSEALDVLYRVGDATQDYRKLVTASKGVPSAQKKQLRDIVAAERRLLDETIMSTRKPPAAPRTSSG